MMYCSCTYIWRLSSECKGHAEVRGVHLNAWPAARLRRKTFAILINCQKRSTNAADMQTRDIIRKRSGNVRYGKGANTKERGIYKPSVGASNLAQT